MTPEKLAEAMRIKLTRATLWAPHITKAMADYDIDSDMRVASFLAQIGHESGGLAYAAEIWGPTLAQAKYEGRIDLGNNQDGDGKRFKGRGLIQITGRFNYRATGKALGLPLEDSPELLEQPQWAATSAAWFWKENGCNEIADSGDFDHVSDEINRGRKTKPYGDSNGYADRALRFEWARAALV